ncbi:MAG: hypothetical protein NUV31_08030, partial [Dehalococcoidales bacterium]|nr:hypothetical protein [Dehalococcoidales bacterium]
AANLPACRQVEAADNYTAIVPETLNPGKPATLTISLLKEGRPARDNIEVALLKEGKRIAGTRQTVNGTGTVSIDVPQNLVEGSYEVQVKGTNFADQARVNVVNEYLIFVETDKP